MKIGILTFHFVYNYGAMLQAYALFSSVRRYEKNCEIIDYRPRTIDRLYRPDSTDWIHNIKGVTKVKIKELISKTSFVEFESFLTNHLNISPLKTKITEKVKMQNYDVLIVGSDQVWNPNITNYDETYLLDFATSDVIKTSFSACLGTRSIEKTWKLSLIDKLAEFQSISVREMESQKLLKSLLNGKEVSCIADPVFLLTAERWKELSKSKKLDMPFILLYVLEKNKDIEKAAISLAQKYNCEVVSIHPLFKICSMCDRHFSDIGPQQFLWLVINAEFICTDSFHATAFSSIFGKRVFLKTDPQKGGRIINLIEQTGLEEYEEACDNCQIKCYKSGKRTKENVEAMQREAEQYLMKIVKNSKYQEGNYA